ncbi:PTS lactose/cellobiose transporter subunit IIA [Enterococcus sp. BWM-S5]|uniref:PTS lactose/cellobiose transporter subunit IIA n=1 Tax=Enterococcus larvae TaxID=2794352 RepID=A0ABS4CK20_9ENTE|nr:PTS lactose/cellobiose transporter subunit IIA [Enterococcus larvae]MBP1046951.1 PTS lactose/cellobiose transporter subunit IIA [Enterococcus larvae]
MENKLVEEDWIIGLILQGGTARSLAMQAVDQAAEGKYQLSKDLMQQAHDALSTAHDYHSLLTQDHLEETVLPTPLLLMHGQDHLMSAITSIDMADRMIQLYHRLDKGGI